MTMHPVSSDPAAKFDYYKTIQAQRMPLGKIRPSVTAVGGGVTPINQAEIQKDLGNDIIIGVGGAIQGHPLGTTTGARTVMTAVEAVSKGISLAAAAEECEGLKAALQIWS